MWTVNDVIGKDPKDPEGSLQLLLVFSRVFSGIFSLERPLRRFKESSGSFQEVFH